MLEFPVMSALEIENLTNEESSGLAPSEQNPSIPAKPRPRKRYFSFLLLGIVACGAAGGAWYCYSQGREETEDSYVDGHIATISSRVAGNVTQVFVSDNETVKGNQPLVRLDPRDYQLRINRLKAALKQAEKQTLAAHVRIGQSELSAQGQAIQANGSLSSSGADVEHAKAALHAAKAEERQAAARVRQQDAQVVFAKSDYERYKTVYANRAVTKQQHDRALASLNVANAQLKESIDALDQAQRKIVQAEADLKEAAGHQLTSRGQLTSAIAAGKQADIDKHQYQSNLDAVEQAKSDLDQAELQLSYTKIDAPVAGTVGRKSVEVGQRVEVGQPLMSVVQPDPWITANFKETQITKMKVGQEAEIKIDAFPGRTFKGRIDSFSPASGARFSLLPPDNASGNFTKVVQRVPVKIVFDRDSVRTCSARISPGLSCVTTVILK
jgi:membrane fusion protein (multidrug efflux system)